MVALYFYISEDNNKCYLKIPILQIIMMIKISLFHQCKGNQRTLNQEHPVMEGIQIPELSPGNLSFPPLRCVVSNTEYSQSFVPEIWRSLVITSRMILTKKPPCGPPLKILPISLNTTTINPVTWTRTWAWVWFLLFSYSHLSILTKTFWFYLQCSIFEMCVFLGTTST